jgi:hypothetical protein
MNSAFDTRLGGVGAGKAEHFVGHVYPDRFAGRADAAGGDQHVGTCTRAEVEDGLTEVEVRDRRGNTAPERCDERGVGHVSAFVERGAEDLTAGCIGGSRGRVAAAGPDRDGSRGVLLADGLTNVGVGASGGCSTARGGCRCAAVGLVGSFAAGGLGLRSAAARCFAGFGGGRQFSHSESSWSALGIT